MDELCVVHYGLDAYILSSLYTSEEPHVCIYPLKSNGLVMTLALWVAFWSTICKVFYDLALNILMTLTVGDGQIKLIFSSSQG